MELVMNEQDIINAICIYTSERQNCQPEDVEVELIYDDEYDQPFIAEVTANRGTQEISMAECIAAIRLYVERYEAMDGMNVGVDMQLTKHHSFMAVVTE